MLEYKTFRLVFEYKNLLGTQGVRKNRRENLTSASTILKHQTLSFSHLSWENHRCLSFSADPAGLVYPVCLPKPNPQQAHLISWAFSFYSLGHPPHDSVQTSYGADFTHPVTPNEGVSAAPTRRLQPVPSFTRSAGKEMQKLWTDSQEGRGGRMRAHGNSGEKPVQRTRVTLKMLPWLFLSGTRPLKKRPSLERWSETVFITSDHSLLWVCREGLLWSPLSFSS